MSALQDSFDNKLKIICMIINKNLIDESKNESLTFSRTRGWAVTFGIFFCKFIFFAKTKLLRQKIRNGRGSNKGCFNYIQIDELVGFRFVRFII